MNIYELMKSLTREEKIGQLLQIAPFFFIKHAEVEVAGHVTELKLTRKQIFEAGSVLGIGSAKEMIEVQTAYLKHSRHKIPLLFMADIIHGYETIFPVPLGLASTFNERLVEHVARISAIEASTSGIHVTFSPMADLVRDPRWGRVVESFGEDPYLNGILSSAMVRGYQQDDIRKETHLASCVKHYAAYGKVEGGRDYNTVDLSRLSLHHDYLEGYRKAIEAGAKLIMTSFNVVDGIPATVNQYLLRDVLREQWQFQGVTISDYDSLHQIIAHGVATDDKEAAYRGLKAGLDIEMASTAYANHLSELIDEGLIDEQLLDEACLRVLELKEQVGLFENPYKHAYPDQALTIVRSQEHLDFARQVAHESIVLLENDGILPLTKKMSVALVGPYATSRDTNGPWSWHGKNALNANLYEALKDDLNITFIKDSEDPKDYTEQDIRDIERADLVIFACGERIKESGEAHNRSYITLPRKQDRLYDLMRRHAQKLVTIIIAGRPLAIGHLQSSEAIIYAWFPGSEGARAIADIMMGRHHPSGKLPMSFPYHEGQIPVYYNHLNTGRPKIEGDHNEYTSYYLDTPNRPLYPFGYGLTYTTWVLGKPNLQKSTMKIDDRNQLQVTLTNTGKNQGSQVVQVYVRDVICWVSRPVKALKAFQKINLNPGETKTLTFMISPDWFLYYNDQGIKTYEPGEFIIMVGLDSEHTESLHLNIERGQTSWI